MRKEIELIGDLPIEYNPETGVFKYTKSVGNRSKGSIAGVKTNKGYLSIKINKKSYLIHRFAFVLMEQKISVDDDVDHINRIKSDNRWSNLRLVTRSKNSVNAKLREDNILGVKNIRLLNGKFQVRICGKSLGVFDLLEEALYVRDNWMVRELDEKGDKILWKAPTITS